jgi:large subunit ribosomal protein L15
MKLHELTPARGSRRQRQRVGRGIAAGQGKTSGKGQKGQKSRTGSSIPRVFEGGQLPLTQRLPKLRGFNNKWRKEYAAVNIGKLARFEKDAVVDLAALIKSGIVRRGAERVKLLGTGELKHALTVRIDRASAAARKAVETAGGKLEITEEPRAVWVYKAKKTKKTAAPVKEDADADAEKEDVKEGDKAEAPAAEAEPQDGDGSAETTE